ncbi:MAG: hypothetical protein WDO73_33865 [Ignavibacteriota bacterium]
MPRASQGFLHSVAYGIAILLGLVLWTGFRAFAGMKYNPPREKRDLWLPLLGFAMVAPVLALVGIPIGFIPPPHLPLQSAGRMAAAVGIIYAGTDSARGNPVPLAHSKSADATLRLQHADAAAGELHLRLRTSR